MYFLIWSFPVAIRIFAGVLVIPRFEAMFMNFKVQIPAITSLMLDMSRWLRGDGVKEDAPALRAG